MTRDRLVLKIGISFSAAPKFEFSVFDTDTSKSFDLKFKIKIKKGYESDDEFDEIHRFHMN